jgi:hypothetical protein
MRSLHGPAADQMQAQPSPRDMPLGPRNRVVGPGVEIVERNSAQVRQQRAGRCADRASLFSTDPLGVVSGVRRDSVQ